MQGSACVYGGIYLTLKIASPLGERLTPNAINLHIPFHVAVLYMYNFVLCSRGNIATVVRMCMRVPVVL